MLSSLLAGVLSAVLLDVGSQSVTPTGRSDEPSQAVSTTRKDPNVFALRLPGSTLCFGQPSGVRCDRYWPLTAPTPASQKAAPDKKSWHFTLLDRTFCFGEVPQAISCTVRFDPAAAADQVTNQTANKTANQTASQTANKTTNKTAT